MTREVFYTIVAFININRFCIRLAVAKSVILNQTILVLAKSDRSGRKCGILGLATGNLHIFLIGLGFGDAYRVVIY